MSDAYPEILADLRDKLAQFFQAEGVATPLADGIAERAAEHVRREWGGQNVYIPKGTHFSVSERDCEMARRFKGDNIREVAKEFGVTTVHAYRVLKAVAAAKRQKD